MRSNYGLYAGTCEVYIVILCVCHMHCLCLIPDEYNKPVKICQIRLVLNNYHRSRPYRTLTINADQNRSQINCYHDAFFGCECVDSSFRHICDKHSFGLLRWSSPQLLRAKGSESILDSNCISRAHRV